MNENEYEKWDIHLEENKNDVGFFLGRLVNVGLRS
jgi:hypothetical protein